MNEFQNQIRRSVHQAAMMLRIRQRMPRYLTHARVSVYIRHCFWNARAGRMEFVLIPDGEN